MFRLKQKSSKGELKKYLMNVLNSNRWYKPTHQSCRFFVYFIFFPRFVCRLLSCQFSFDVFAPRYLFPFSCCRFRPSPFSFVFRVVCASRAFLFVAFVSFFSCVFFCEAENCYMLRLFWYLLSFLSSLQFMFPHHTGKRIHNKNKECVLNRNALISIPFFLFCFRVSVTRELLLLLLNLISFVLRS